MLLKAATSWWPAREVVKKSILNRKEADPSGEIFVLEERCSWKDHLYAIEEELGIEGELKFVIFHDMTGSWRVQGIPVQPDSFICRLNFFLFTIAKEIYNFLLLKCSFEFHVFLIIL